MSCWTRPSSRDKSELTLLGSFLPFNVLSPVVVRGSRFIGRIVHIDFWKEDKKTTVISTDPLYYPHRCLLLCPLQSSLYIPAKNLLGSIVVYGRDIASDTDGWTDSLCGAVLGMCRSLGPANMEPDGRVGSVSSASYDPKAFLSRTLLVRNFPVHLIPIGSSTMRNDDTSASLATVRATFALRALRDCFGDDVVPENHSVVESLEKKSPTWRDNNDKNEKNGSTSDKTGIPDSRPLRWCAIYSAIGCVHFVLDQNQKLLADPARFLACFEAIVSCAMAGFRLCLHWKPHGNDEADTNKSNDKNDENSNDGDEGNDEDHETVSKQLYGTKQEAGLVFEAMRKLMDGFLELEKLARQYTTQQTFQTAESLLATHRVVLHNVLDETARMAGINDKKIAQRSMDSWIVRTNDGGDNTENVE